MILREVINKKTGETLTIMQEEDFEYVNPIKQFGDFFIFQGMYYGGVPHEELQGNKPPSDNGIRVFKEFVKLWDTFLKEVTSKELEPNLLALLTSKKKSDQEKLLKGVILTPEILMNLIIKAHQNYGYTLSQYSSEFSQKGIDLSKMPFAYQTNPDGTTKIYGKTELSDGQLRQAIEHRKVKIAKFLDNGENWHCFFLTFKSLRGEETWQGVKQPHYHYISNHFGISREAVIKALKSEEYKLGNLPHIKLEDYGNQPS